MSWGHRRVHLYSVSTPTLVTGGWLKPHPDSFTLGKQTWRLFYMMPIGPHGWSERVSRKESFLLHRVRIQNRPAYIESLYRPCHLDPPLLQINNFNYLWGFRLCGFWCWKHLLETKSSTRSAQLAAGQSASVQFLLLHPFWHSLAAGDIQ